MIRGGGLSGGSFDTLQWSGTVQESGAAGPSISENVPRTSRFRTSREKW